jgi:hypothetical protein
MLKSNAIEGYTQVSRVGEQVVNCFVDTYEFGVVPDVFSQAEMLGEAFNDGTDVLKKPDGSAYTDAQKRDNKVETKPHFYAWATATTGMLAVARKQRSTFRNYVAAETAAPVIACAAGKGPLDELDFQFAGVVRSNSVRTMDDGVGPTTDEYFTLTIGGPATILNNSKDVIHAGDTIAWTFYSEHTDVAGAKRAAHGSVRRIGIRIADFHDECKIGKAINFAKPGQTFDVSIQRFQQIPLTIHNLSNVLTALFLLVLPGSCADLEGTSTRLQSPFPILAVAGAAAPRAPGVGET